MRHAPLRAVTMAIWGSRSSSLGMTVMHRTYPFGTIRAVSLLERGHGRVSVVMQRSDN